MARKTARTSYPYADYSATLQNLLDLSGFPVAIGFAHTPDDIPDDLPEISTEMRHCQMVREAREEGKSFFARRESHNCAGGAWSLGLSKQTESLKTGEFYFKLGKFESFASCKRTINSIPHVESESVYATLYSPLHKTPFDPAVVLFIAEPKSLLKLSQAYLYTCGGRIHSSFSGIQSVCADVTTQPYISGNINISLGCDGSRKLSKIEPEQMVAGIPIEILPNIVTALPIVCGAPGSS